MCNYTDKAGWSLTVSSCGFLDWGVSICAPTGETLLDSPHCLSADSYSAEELADPETFKVLAQEMFEEVYMCYMVENMDDIPAPSCFV